MNTFSNFTLCLILTVLAARGAQTSVIVSSAPRPSATGGGGSFQPVLSADGRDVAFVSQANNLVTNDGLAPSLDVFLRHRFLGVTTLVSVSTNGVGGGDDNSVGPVLSADNRFVAFQSAAGNLAANDTNGLNDVFLRDTVAGTTLLVSRELTGRSSPNRASIAPLLSADGRWVVYESAATNLVANDTNNAADIFVFDRLTGNNALVSVNDAGSGSRDGVSRSPNITADGRWVAYVNFASNTVPVVGQVQVRDTQAGTAVWASSNAMASLSGYQGALQPVLSGDGSCVFFHAYSATETNLYRFELQSGAGTLVSTGAQARSLPSPSVDGRFLAFERESSVFVWDAQPGNNTPASLTRSGLPAASREAVARPVLTSDGGKVFFLSDAGELTGDPTNGLPQLYLRDLALGTNFLLSADTNGAAAGDLGAMVPSINADGSLVAFESGAATLVADDLNLATDVFVRDVVASATQLISASATSRPGRAGVATATLYPNSISADGRYVAYGSFDNYLFPGDTNGVQDIFVRDVANGTVEAASVSAAGEFTNVLQSVNPVLSAGGRHVAYVVVQSLPVFPRRSAVFWRDLAAGQTRVVSEPPGGFQWEESAAPAISPDGRWVAFQTTRLVSAFGPPSFSDANGSATDVMLHDTATGTNVLVSRNKTSPLGAAGGASRSPVFSPDGRWLAFASLAADVTTNGWNNTTNLFVRDLLSNSTIFVSHNWSGYGSGAAFSGSSRYLAFAAQDPAYAGGAGRRVVVHDLQAGVNSLLCSGCRNPSISADGRYVVVETIATPSQVVLHDRQTGRTNFVSADRMYSSLGANGNSYAPVLSGDARFIAFVSRASNLEAADASPRPNIYIRDRVLATTRALRIGPGDGLGNGASYQPAFAADGRTLVFTSFASDLADGDYNDRRDVFTVKLAVDSDADGLDDDWEVAFFNDLSRDGNGDFDGDGQSDRMEFLSGTDPTNQGSVLRAQFFTGSAFVTWSVVAGRTYQVQFKDSMDSGWFSLASPMLAISTGAMTQLDNLQPRPAQRFYRVLIVQ